MTESKVHHFSETLVFKSAIAKLLFVQSKMSDMERCCATENVQRQTKVSELVF